MVGAELRQAERARTRARHGVDLGQTARELGIERTNLYRKMKQLGIQPAAARARSTP